MTLFSVIEHYTSLWDSTNKKSGSEPDSFDVMKLKRITTEERGRKYFPSPFMVLTIRMIQITLAPPQVHY